MESFDSRDQVPVQGGFTATCSAGMAGLRCRRICLAGLESERFGMCGNLLPFCRLALITLLPPPVKAAHG